MWVCVCGCVCSNFESGENIGVKRMERKKLRKKKKEKKKVKIDPARIRTWNPLIRSQMPYPLGHRAVV